MWKLVLLLLGVVAMAAVACGDVDDEPVAPDAAPAVPFPTEAPAPDTVLDVAPAPEIAAAQAEPTQTVPTQASPTEVPAPPTPEAMSITTPVEAVVVVDERRSPGWGIPSKLVRPAHP